jgi:hypothetical protein
MRFTTSMILLTILTISVGLSVACGPPSSPGGKDGTASDPAAMPELTDDVIRERINDGFVRNIPEENGAADPISWRFYESEPKEIQIIDKQVDGTRATVVLDIKTSSSPGTRNPRQLAGQIRTEWKLETGWVLRKWEIVRTENISMKYKNLPKTTKE